MPSGMWGHELVHGATTQSIKDEIEERITSWCGERMFEEEGDTSDVIAIGDEIYRLEISANLIPLR